MKKSFLFALVALLCACEGPVNTVGVKKMQLSLAQERMVVTSNDFTYDLFNQVASNEAKNCFISPLSASFALSMLANGADSETLDEILTVLGFGDYSLDDLNDYHKSLLEALPYLDNKTKIAIANAIFIKENYPIYDAFKQVNKDYYFARVENLDFNSSSAADHINRWAANNTNNKIKKIIDAQTLRQQNLVLANALSFKGNWRKVFKKENTKPEEFTNADGSKTMVDMMNIDDSFCYGQTEQLHLLEMSYKGNAYVMDIIIPQEGKTLADVRNSLNDSIFKHLSLREVEVKMPKFTMEYERELNKDLQVLGMNSAFDGTLADFSKLSENPLYVDFVKQNTFLALDEEGTEAAAITIIGAPNSAELDPLGKVHFYVNEPFIFIIREVEAKTILFIGEVNKL